MTNLTPTRESQVCSPNQSQRMSWPPAFPGGQLLLPLTKVLRSCACLWVCQNASLGGWLPCCGKLRTKNPFFFSSAVSWSSFISTPHSTGGVRTHGRWCKEAGMSRGVLEIRVLSCLSRHYEHILPSCVSLLSMMPALVFLKSAFYV